MKLVTKYLLKELSAPFLLGIVLFTFVLLFGKFLKLTDLVVNKGLNVLDLILFIVLGVPETFILIVPMSVVLATLMAYGRLASDNELIVLRASGYPLRSLLIPTLVTGLAASLVLVGFSEYGAPQISRYRHRQLSSMKQPDPEALMKARTYQTVGPFTLFANEVRGKQMFGVYIEDHRTPRTKLIYSKSGTWDKEESTYFLTLRDGSVHQRGKNDEQYRVLKFQKQTIQFRRKSSNVSTGEEQKQPLSKKWDLYQQASHRYRNLSDKEDQEKVKHARMVLRKRSISLHRSLAFPFASFFLVLIAAPLGVLSKREGKSLGFSISIGIIFLYYMITTFAEPLALNGWLPPPVAMWSANIVFGISGIGLLTWLRLRKG